MIAADYLKASYEHVTLFLEYYEDELDPTEVYELNELIHSLTNAIQILEYYRDLPYNKH